MPACSGVLLDLRELHGMQEHTMFSQVVGPLCWRGTTWSRFRSRESNFSRNIGRYFCRVEKYYAE